MGALVPDGRAVLAGGVRACAAWCGKARLSLPAVPACKAGHAAGSLPEPLLSLSLTAIFIHPVLACDPPPPAASVCG